VKKFKSVILVSLVLGSLVSTYASRMDEVTLVMVPREDSVIRVGMDIANRYPTLLISYQVGGGGVVSLHGWTGTEWVNVTPEAFKEGAFFNTAPTDAVLVEKDGQPIPEMLVPSEAWCFSVHKISTIDTRPLLHLIGRHYNFKYSDWKWFASNYKLSIEDINPEELNIAWYNKPLGEHLRRKSAAVGASDLEYWSIVRQPMDAVEAMADEMLISEEIEQTSDMESLESLEGEDPLTNSIPSAVILGAGDAAEDLAAEPELDDADTAEDLAVEAELDDTDTTEDLVAEMESDVADADKMLNETEQE
jgi:hypothetical protein